MENLITDHIETWTTAKVQKATGGRGRGKKSNGQRLYGIKKLRELILELAVRGKLVPQDPNDLPAPRPGKWFVYVLECEDGSLYKGFTHDILERWKQHATGKGAEWTKIHPPKKLVHWEEFESKAEAVAREKVLKSGFGRKWLHREIAAGRTRQAGEPASVLLEKIADEKARLVKEGKIKKQKPLPEIGEDEKAFELPQGWEWRKLGDVIEFINGFAFKSKDFSESGVGIVKIGDIQSGKIETKSMSRVDASIVANLDNSIQVYKDEMLIAMSGATTGKLGFNRTDEIFYINQRVGKISPYGIDVDYLFYPLTTKIAENLAKSMGSAIPNLSTQQIKNIVIAIPPLAEQHRIVTKVDELMALCDLLEQEQTDNSETHQLLVKTLLDTLTHATDHADFIESWQRIEDSFDILFTTPESIDDLKQTILQLAVMGKLVPQDPNDLPAPRPGKWFVYVLECEDGSLYKGFTHDILERWKQHATGKGAEWTKIHPPKKLVHWEEFESKAEAVAREKVLKSGFGRKWLHREIAAGRTRQAGEPASVLLGKIAEEKARLVKEGKIKKQKPLPEIGEDEKPFELPDGWAWTRLNDYYDVRDGTHDSPKTVLTGYPLITSKNLYSGNLDINNVNYISHEDHLKIIERSKVDKGDILFAMIGSIGNPAIVDTDKDFSIKNVALFKYYSVSNSAPSFLLIYLKHTSIEMKEKASGGVQSFVPLGRLRSYVMASPPIQEQHRIVSKVDELMVICESLNERLIDAQATQVQLADAIVGQAVAV